MYRPDEWKNPFDDLKLINAPENLYGKGKFVCTGLRKKQGKEDFEAGAAAMLRALRGDAWCRLEPTDFINIRGREYTVAKVKGTLVFIPDEES